MGFEIQCREIEMTDNFSDNANPEIVIMPGLVQPIDAHEGVANGSQMPLKITIREQYGRRLITVYT